jgi:hypothetical protein
VLTPQAAKACGVFYCKMMLTKINAWCINLEIRPEKYAEFVKQPIPFEVTRFNAIANKNGMLGCIDSHHTVMKFFGNGINMIFEEDAEFINNWDYLAQAITQLPADWHCLYLGAMLHKTITRFSKNLFRLEHGWCTHAVLHNGKTIASEILKKSPEQIHKEWNNIDTYFVYEIQPKFNCFLIDPMIALQRPCHSDIINQHRDYSFLENFKKHTS